VVADGFAGVGPFAIPAAKNRRCMVYANDLNPQSVRWLRENVTKNKVGDYVEVTESDGRAFIAGIFRKAWQNPRTPAPPIKTSKQKAKERHYRKEAEAAGVPVLPTPALAPEQPQQPPLQRIHHVVMNLPDSALTFLDAFRGVLNIPTVPQAAVEKVYTDMPLVHVHCFTRELELDAARTDLSAVSATGLDATPASDEHSVACATSDGGTAARRRSVPPCALGGTEQRNVLHHVQAAQRGCLCTGMNMISLLQ